VIIVLARPDFAELLVVGVQRGQQGEQEGD
jgi:hypothetical protein